MSHDGGVEVHHSCDVVDCRSRGSATRYRVAYPDGVLSVHLCRRHAGTLHELRRQVDKDVRVTRGRPRNPSTAPVNPDDMPSDL